MAQGRNECAQLEERRSKLLLSPVPHGPGAAAEVQKRLTLWEERRFEELFQRAEEHLLLSRKPGKRKNMTGWLDASSRVDRARRTAPVGAYREATSGLVSSMLSFDEHEDLFWTKELLSTSAQGVCWPTAAQIWNLRLMRTGTDLFLACTATRAHHRPVESVPQALPSPFLPWELADVRSQSSHR